MKTRLLALIVSICCLCGCNGLRKSGTPSRSPESENGRGNVYGLSTVKKDRCKMDMKLTLSKVPKLNEEVEITLSLTPLDSLYPHAPTDQARIYLQEYGYLELEYVKGDTLWVGEIKRGETVTLKVWVKPVWGGMYRTYSSVAYLRRGVIHEQKGIYGYTGINKTSSDSFFVKGPSKPVDKRRQWHTDKGVRIRMVTDTLEIDSFEVNPIRNDSMPPDTEQHNSIDRLDEAQFANSCEDSVIGEKCTGQITASSTIYILSRLVQVNSRLQGRSR